MGCLVQSKILRIDQNTACAVMGGGSDQLGMSGAATEQTLEVVNFYTIMNNNS